ncbi:TPA: hypothetical protein QDA84_000470 [Burkholderia vietnamiensis]|nr:hypothetical protein [Burkholderia vietnamiensis]
MNKTLTFRIERRGDFDVLVYNHCGCRPATNEEMELWNALLAAQQPESRRSENPTGIGYDTPPEELERILAQTERRAEMTDDDVAKLKRFAGLVLKDHRNGGYPGDVDGGELQAYAEQCGLIEERRVESPCGENCSCTDFGEFPTTCYFNTDLGKAVIDAARAGEAS